jgi:nondiscriminating aspartyl-tRNA synthetase
VYRAEPHATSRHLTEYYSLDLEMGFIEGPEDVIELERELCRIAEAEHGVAAVFVLGFPLSARPFYTHPRVGPGRQGAAAGFDLLFNGLEITTGGQRLHTRADLEASLLARGLSPTSFESHLRMFELGMPPHGGLAIGLERLTTQILGLQNIREATLYPRDRYRVTP